jgi:AcrR family transcriptional regulator
MANPPDPARRSDRARAAVLAAAWELVETQGWSAVTVDGIAAAAGVGKQTIYRWWRGKGDVVFDAFLTAARPRALRPRTDDVEDVLRTHARNFVRLYAGTPLGRHLRELLGAAQHDPELAEAMRDRWFVPRREPLRAALTRARQEGRLAADTEVDTVLDLLFGPLHYRLLTGSGPVDRRYADAVTDLVLAAISG